MSAKPCECKPVSIFQKTWENQKSEDKINNRGTPSPLSNGSASSHNSAPPLTAGYQCIPASLSGALGTTHTTATSTLPRILALTPCTKQVELPPIQMFPRNSIKATTTFSDSQALWCNFKRVQASSGSTNPIGSLKPMETLDWVDYRKLSSTAASL